MSKNIRHVIWCGPCFVRKEFFVQKRRAVNALLAEAEKRGEAVKLDDVVRGGNRWYKFITVRWNLTPPQGCQVRDLKKCPYETMKNIRDIAFLRKDGSYHQYSN